MQTVQALIERIITNIERVVVGKAQAVELVVIGLLARGHVLIEDVPGVGKTMLARSLALSVGCSFNRIQATPDMLPSDLTGVTIFNQLTRSFEFHPGPLFANIVLVDEINRATPKTQAALLEAMAEMQITVDGVTHPLPQPFMVLATQNPLEYEGTFALPEGQLDRFMLRVNLGYPERNDEIQVLREQKLRHPIEELSAVVSVDELLAAQEAVKQVYVAPAVEEYIVDLTRQTRALADVFLGAGPRGSLALYRAAQVRAARYGRSYVLPDDVKALALPVLAHRLILGPGARFRSQSTQDILQELLTRLSVPAYRGE